MQFKLLPIYILDCHMHTNAEAMGCRPVGLKLPAIRNGVVIPFASKSDHALHDPYTATLLVFSSH